MALSHQLFSSVTSCYLCGAFQHSAYDYQFVSRSCYILHTGASKHVHCANAALFNNNDDDDFEHGVVITWSERTKPTRIRGAT